MSSWDRVRSIPWSRALPVKPPSPNADDDETVDSHRERVFRELAREAARDDKEEEKKRKRSSEPLSGGSADGTDFEQQQQPPNGSAAAAPTDLNILGYQGRPYQTSDLIRNLAFGGMIGSITGMCFGFMDGMRSATTSPVLKNASRAAQSKYLFQGTTRSGMVFGAFFAGFHGIKYAVRVLVDPGDAGEIAVGTTLGLGAVVARPETRASLPYAAMLIGMDGFHIMMREYDEK